MPGAPVSGARQRPATSRARLRQALFSRSNAAELPSRRNGFAAGSGRNMPTSHRPGTLRPARHVVPRPTRKNTIFASRAAPQYFSRRKAEKPQAKARRFRLFGLLSGLSNGKRSSSPGRPPVSPLPFRQTQFKRGPRAQKPRSRIAFRSFQTSPTPPSEGSSWSPRAARWSGPAPCRRSSRAPPGRCPDG